MKNPELSHKEFLRIDKDYIAAAESSGLRYVTDGMAGIRRIRETEGFTYQWKNKTITDERILERIKKLGIPPAWENVWIASTDDAHIQATGTDVRGRKQYRYHKQWNELRNETKFHRMLEFGKHLPALRLQMETDLAKAGLPQEKVIATVLSVMERTYIRIGNSGYEKLYGSYGLTTLKDKHVQIEKGQVVFSFVGKKGIRHNISMKHKRLAKAVQACKDIPGKELFQYVTEDGNHKPVDSGMVNQYIKDASGGSFSAKDFRTWAGSLRLLHAFMDVDLSGLDTEKARKAAVKSALEQVSKHLGNTATVCRKYYVHPGILKMCEENEIGKYLKQLDALEIPDDQSGLTNDEKVLMRILKSF